MRFCVPQNGRGSTRNDSRIRACVYVFDVYRMRCFNGFGRDSNSMMIFYSKDCFKFNLIITFKVCSITRILISNKYIPYSKIDCAKSYLWIVTNLCIKIDYTNRWGVINYSFKFAISKQDYYHPSTYVRFVLGSLWGGIHRNVGIIS